MKSGSQANKVAHVGPVGDHNPPGWVLLLDYQFCWTMSEPQVLVQLARAVTWDKDRHLAGHTKHSPRLPITQSPHSMLPVAACCSIKCIDCILVPWGACGAPHHSLTAACCPCGSGCQPPGGSCTCRVVCSPASCQLLAMQLPLIAHQPEQTSSHTSRVGGW